jgi:hypothetical protein
MTLNQVQIEREQAKELTDRIEKQLKEVFKTIPSNTEEKNIPTKEKIEKTTHDLEAYKSNIS